MKKSFIPTLVILLAIAVIAGATQYEWVKQGTQNQKIGFGSVVSATSTGSIAISSCDGMAYADGLRSMQMGTGTLAGDDQFQYRDNLILEDDQILGLVVYGGMIKKYSMWQDDCFDGGYVANAAVTNVGGLNIAGGYFSEVADLGTYLVTVVDGGTNNSEAIVVDDAIDGVRKVTTSAVANDTVQYQLGGEAFKLNSTTTNRLWYETRFGIGDVSSNNCAVGLCLASATDVIGTPGADNIYFNWIGASNTLHFVVTQDSTATTVDTGVALLDYTDQGELVRAGFTYEADGTISVYVAGTLITNLTDDGSTIVFPDDEELTAFVAIEAVSAVAASVYVDYHGVINERYVE